MGLCRRTLTNGGLPLEAAGKRNTDGRGAGRMQHLHKVASSRTSSHPRLLGLELSITVKLIRTEALIGGQLQSAQHVEHLLVLV